MRPELVVTDLAGTTVSDPGLVLGAFRAGLDIAGVDVDEADLVRLMGVDKREAFAILLDLDQDDPVIDAALDAFVARAVADAESGAYVVLPGVDRALERLAQAGIAVAFTTGFGSEILTALLRTNGWSSALAGSVASDQVHRGRPAPDIVEEAMRRHDVTEASAVAVIGDTVVDIGCANAVGAGWAFGVLTGSGTAEELAREGGHVVADFASAVDVLLGPDPSDSVARIVELFDRWGSDRYDEAVTQLEHALQCADLAETAGAPDVLVAAALLHDIGHLMVLEREQGHVTYDHDDDHEDLAADWLAGAFPARVVDAIRMHVDAKRFLCATEPGYLGALSDASRRSLEMQGGIMSDTEAQAFIIGPHARDAVLVRRWDDRAKVPGAPTTTLVERVPLLRAVQSTAR